MTDLTGYEPNRASRGHTTGEPRSYGPWGPQAVSANSAINVRNEVARINSMGATPERAALRSEVGDLTQRLAQSEEYYTDLGRQALNQQRQAFESAAERFKAEARDVRDVEVAEARADADRNAQAVVIRAKRQAEADARGEVRAQQQQAEQVLDAERAYSAIGRADCTWSTTTLGTCHLCSA